MGSANLFLQYDIYHMQIMEGDLARTMATHLDEINHIQLADNPGRDQPARARSTIASCSSIWIGLATRVGSAVEYKPLTTTEAGLGWLKTHNAI